MNEFILKVNENNNLKAMCVRALIFKKQMIFPSVQSYVIVIHFSDARSKVKTS